MCILNSCSAVSPGTMQWLTVNLNIPLYNPFCCLNSNTLIPCWLYYLMQLKKSPPKPPKSNSLTSVCFCQLYRWTFGMTQWSPWGEQQSFHKVSVFMIYLCVNQPGSALSYQSFSTGKSRTFYKLCSKFYLCYCIHKYLPSTPPGFDTGVYNSDDVWCT